MLSGHAQRLGAMPASLVEDHHGMGIRGDLGRDLGQMQVHGLRCRQTGRTSAAVRSLVGHTAAKR